MDCPNPKKSASAAAAGIPDDALMEILSRLPIKPLCRSKCVAKAWRDLIADPLHRKKLPQTLAGFFYGSGGGTASPRQHQEYVNFINLLWTSAAPFVDPPFPFMEDLPGIENVSLLGSCNGLLLFDYGPSIQDLSFVVCNPATREWVAVPGKCIPVYSDYPVKHTSLIFDPAASSHFHVVQFWEKSRETLVHVYSSKTGMWRCSRCHWGDLQIVRHLASAFVNGVLYVTVASAFVNGVLYVTLSGRHENEIVAWDTEVGTRKIITAPFLACLKWCLPVPDYVGQSQGKLHYIYHEQGLEADDDTDFVGTERWSYELCVWVLEDYDTQQWALKHTVSFLELFGKVNWRMGSGFNVIAIHPDHNLVYLVQHWNQKLISYDMDSREVSDLCTLAHGYGSITPYVPFFLESAALENKY